MTERVIQMHFHWINETILIHTICSYASLNICRGSLSFNAIDNLIIIHCILEYLFMFSMRSLWIFAKYFGIISLMLLILFSSLGSKPKNEVIYDGFLEMMIPLDLEYETRKVMTCYFAMLAFWIFSLDLTWSFLNNSLADNSNFMAATI